jgi:hypothetical protein
MPENRERITHNRRQSCCLDQAEPSNCRENKVTHSHILKRAASTAIPPSVNVAFASWSGVEEEMGDIKS